MQCCSCTIDDGRQEAAAAGPLCSRAPAGWTARWWSFSGGPQLATLARDAKRPRSTQSSHPPACAAVDGGVAVAYDIQSTGIRQIYWSTLAIGLRASGRCNCFVMLRSNVSRGTRRCPAQLPRLSGDQETRGRIYPLSSPVTGRARKIAGSGSVWSSRPEFALKNYRRVHGVIPQYRTVYARCRACRKWGRSPIVII